MGIKYIHELPASSAINENDVLVIDDGNRNYKVLWSVFKTLLGSVSAFAADPDTENYPGYLKITLTNGTVLRAKSSDPGKQDKLTFDTTPTEESTNPVTSNGIFAALTDKLDAADYVNFTGATDNTDGTAGKVPAPAAGGERYLSSGGIWETPDSEPTEDSAKLISSGAVYDSIHGLQLVIADEYNSGHTYPLGYYAMHEGELYRSTVAIPQAEEWDPSHWQNVTVGEAIEDLAASIAGVTDAEYITYDGSLATHRAGSVGAELSGLGVDDEDQELAIDLILNELIHRKVQFDSLSDTVASQGTRLTTAEGNISSQGTRLSTAETNITNQGARLSTAEGNITKLLARTEIEAGSVTLTNDQAFPFNSSQVTVPLVTERANQNYIVDYEVTAAVGNVGDIIVSAKLVNGFKIEFTGSATSVTVKYQVLGGMA